MIGPVDEHYNVRLLRCPQTGIVVEEKWTTPNNKLHRLDGPALIKRDEESGGITHTSYYKNGKLTRDEGEPAYSEFDPHTGNCWYRVFSLDGIYFRPDNRPHVEFLDRITCHVHRAEYCMKVDGKRVLHRIGGPALLTFNPETGRANGAWFYEYGRQKSDQRMEESHDILRPEC